MHNLVFFGSDQYSAIVLTALHQTTEIHIRMVITDQPHPKGRDQRVEPNPVEKVAKEQKIKISYYPEKEQEMINLLDTIKNTHYDTGVAASFDHLLPPAIITLFPKGILNVHPSLLPQYRNVSPVQYALAMGDRETGVSIFKISEGIDNGEIVAQATEHVDKIDTNPTLSARLFQKGADLVIQYIRNNLKVGIREREGKKLIFTRRLTRDSGYIEWHVINKLLLKQPVSIAETNNVLLQTRLDVKPEGDILGDFLRALYPWPGVWTIAETKKGELRLSIISIDGETMVKIAGKPNPISWKDFQTYYL